MSIEQALETYGICTHNSYSDRCRECVVDAHKKAEARVAELEAAICRHVRAREGESGERPDMTVAVLYRIEHAIKARDAKAPGPSVSVALPKTDAGGDVLVWRARPDCGGAWLYDADLTSLAKTIADGAEGGMVYELEAVEMTKEEWAAVPDDFPGW